MPPNEKPSDNTTSQPNPLLTPSEPHNNSLGTTVPPAETNPNSESPIAAIPTPANNNTTLQPAEGSVGNHNLPNQPYTQQAGHYTLNTTSVESKVGLYTNVTFTSLWVLILVVCSAISSLLVGGDEFASVLVFLFSVSVIATPIFLIANSKRLAQLKMDPSLTEDIFVKKYLRRSLFAAIALTAIAVFILVYNLLSGIFLNNGIGIEGNVIISAFVYAVGFGGMLIFCWNQHATTKR